VHHEPPEVAWPEPELDDGLEDGLLRPLELDDPLLELFEVLDPLEPLEPLELLPEVPELDELELEPDVPELVLPVLDELPDLTELAELLVADPGRASATAPAASTLATPTVAVVVVIRPLARRRAATALVTASRFRLFMT
jgi:hypothetical protein